MVPLESPDVVWVLVDKDKLLVQPGVLRMSLHRFHGDMVRRQQVPHRCME